MAKLKKIFRIPHWSQLEDSSNFQISIDCFYIPQKFIKSTDLNSKITFKNINTQLYFEMFCGYNINEFQFYTSFVKARSVALYDINQYLIRYRQILKTIKKQKANAYREPPKETVYHSFSKITNTTEVFEYIEEEESVFQEIF